MLKSGPAAKKQPGFATQSPETDQRLFQGLSRRAIADIGLTHIFNGVAGSRDKRNSHRLLKK